MTPVSPSLPFEYFILHDVEPAGSVACMIGSLPVWEHIIDSRGQLYEYAGIAHRDPNGRLDVGALRPGEWLLEPNLIYYRIGPS